MADVVSHLNRLLAIHYRSLPMYLADAGIWRSSLPHDEELGKAIDRLTSDYRQTCGRIATAILDRNGTIEPSAFPMEFTDTNFLSLDYMLGEITELHKQDMDAMRRIVVAVGHDADAKYITQECLGAAKRIWKLSNPLPPSNRRS
ncbi:MAG: hypothetical protein QM775_22440 [Pirellulales bacterium]